MSCYSILDLGLGWGRNKDKDSFALGLVFQLRCHVGKELQFSYNRRTYKIPPCPEGIPEVTGGGTDVTAMKAYLGYVDRTLDLRMK